jgi:hypothetical protein
MAEREALLRAAGLAEGTAQYLSAYRAPTRIQRVGRASCKPAQECDHVADHVAREVLRSTRNVIVVNLLILTGLLLAAFYGLKYVLANLKTLELFIVLTLAGLATLLAFINLVRALQFRRNRCQHPALRPLAARGNVADQLASLETELANAERFGSIRLATQWLLHPRLFGFDLIPLADLAWGTLLMKVTYTLFIETDRKTKAVDLYNLNGRRYRLAVSSEQKGTELLCAVAARAPWILIGGEALQSFWQQAPRAVMELVEERRKRLAEKHEVEFEGDIQD